MAYVERKERPDDIIIRDADITFLNFAGEEKTNNGRVVNDAGDRNFSVRIHDQDWANRLLEDGWNVRIKTAEDRDPSINLKVLVRFKSENPRIPTDPTIIMVENGKQTRLYAEDVGILDSANIVKVDLDINPSYRINDRTGCFSAYVKTMYVTVESTDVFASEYSTDIPFDEE